jgi:DNA-binding LacI/PurR family transcriptional regulator
MNKKDALVQAEELTKETAELVEVMKNAQLSTVVEIIKGVENRLSALAYLISYANTGDKPDDFKKVMEAAFVPVYP